jgi:hypothetical protein
MRNEALIGQAFRYNFRADFAADSLQMQQSVIIETISGCGP